MPMEHDEHEQRDGGNVEIDRRVSAAFAPGREASARVVAGALGARDTGPVRPRRLQSGRFIALCATALTGLTLAVLVAAFAWPRKPASPALVIIAGQSRSSERGGSYVMVVPVQKEGK